MFPYTWVTLLSPHPTLMTIYWIRYTDPELNRTRIQILYKAEFYAN